MIGSAAATRGWTCLIVGAGILGWREVETSGSGRSHHHYRDSRDLTAPMIIWPAIRFDPRAAAPSPCDHHVEAHWRRSLRRLARLAGAGGIGRPTSGGASELSPSDGNRSIERCQCRAGWTGTDGTDPWRSEWSIFDVPTGSSSEPVEYRQCFAIGIPTRNIATASTPTDGKIQGQSVELDFLRTTVRPRLAALAVRCAGGHFFNQERVAKNVMVPAGAI
jgi:hypothetical protein